MKYIIDEIFKLKLEDYYYLAGIFTFIVILSTLKLMNKQQFEESRPYVILYIYKPDPYDDYAYICLENIGKSGAYNVNIDKKIIYNIDNGNNNKSNINSSYSFLAPGQKIQWLIKTNSNNENITGVIKYHNNKSKKISNSYSLDFKLYTGTLYIHSNLHNIATSLDIISKKK